MATIRLESTDESPKSCGDHSSPVLVKDRGFYEFQDASELELAFWNTLDQGERREMAKRSHDNCFFDLLHERMKEESDKGEKMKKEEDAALGGETKGPAPPESPPVAPPSGGPPIRQ